MVDISNATNDDSLKVNLYLFGIIGLFVFLTLVAYLLTDGRSYCVIPLLRRCCPNSKWVKGYDTQNRDKNFKLEGTHHVVCGVKKAQYS